MSPSLNRAKIVDSFSNKHSQQAVHGSWGNHMRSDLHQMRS